jgi:glutamyl/glutaminyl-tRNA synthetase
MALEQERVGSLADLGPKCSFFLQDVPEMDSKAAAKWKGQTHVAEMLAEFAREIEGQTQVSVEWCEALLRGYAARNGMEKLGPVVHPTRLALTGSTVGPGLWELMSALGPERLVKRLTVNGGQLA